MQKNTDFKLHYELQNPNYSIYHRAALGGLASTIKAWGRDRPPEIQFKTSSDSVSITWPDELSDAEALRRILAWSFRISDDKMIDMPGQRFAERKDLQALTHYGMLNTFLQNALTRTCEKNVRRIAIDCGKNELPIHVQYKGVTQYAHQLALGTGLLDKKNRGKFPPFAQITQPLIPGVLGSGHSLRCLPPEAILLLFVSVASSIFILRSSLSERTNIFGILIPDVRSLKDFSEQQKKLNSSLPFKKFRTNSFEGRIVGNIEEAGLKLLIDTDATKVDEERRPWRAITMGEVQWDLYQNYRTGASTIDADTNVSTAFLTVADVFKRCVHIMDPNFNSYQFPASFLTSDLAKNSIENRKWYHGLNHRATREEDLEHLFFESDIFARLLDDSTNEDSLLVGIFHKAWSVLVAREHAQGYREPPHHIQSLKVSLLHSFIRLKSIDQVISWFKDFIDINSDKTDIVQRTQVQRLCKWWHNQNAADDLQALLVVALLTCPKRFSSAHPVAQSLETFRG